MYATLPTKKVIAYTAQIIPDGRVSIERTTAGSTDYCLSKNFGFIAEFLTKDMGGALHIVWNLEHFTKILFSLLETPPSSTRTQIGASKIFYVEKMLGLGFKKYLKGNICENYENNFYSLQHWMPEQDESKDALELARRGEKVLEALELLNIYPEKLTSPVGVFSQSLPPMPTLLSGPEMLVDVANYCAPIMRKEWRQTFQQGYFEKLHSYDIVSAYPYFIGQLPDTDHCKIEKVTDTIIGRNQWGIYKGNFTPNGRILPFKQTDFLTSDQLRWIDIWGAGHFEVEDGYVLTFLNDRKPYLPIIESLYNQRITAENELVAFLAKNMAQGISGKLDEVHEESYGDFCNPIYATMVRAKTALRLGHWISTWIKNSQVKQNELVNVNLDEVCFRNPVKGFCQNEALRPGDWRYRVKEKVVIA